MSANLKKYLPALQFIASIKNKNLREGILKQYAGDANFCSALREIAINTVNKNIALPKETKKKLKRFKKPIIDLTKNNKSKTIRKKKIIQSGGFLPSLIPILLTLLK